MATVKLVSTLYHTHDGIAHDVGDEYTVPEELAATFEAAGIAKRRTAATTGTRQGHPVEPMKTQPVEAPTPDALAPAIAKPARAGRVTSRTPKPAKLKAADRRQAKPLGKAKIRGAAKAKGRPRKR